MWSADRIRYLNDSISTPSSDIPRANGGFRHVVLAVDVFPSYLTYVPIKSITQPQRFISAIVTKFLNAGHPIKHLKLDNQFNIIEVISYLDSIHVTYHFAPRYEHEYIGRIERYNRTA